MSTIEEIVTRIQNAKLFSVIDASYGFWQVKPMPSYEHLKHCLDSTCPLWIIVFLEHFSKDHVRHVVGH